MNETIVLSPEAFERLRQELQKTGPIQTGHGGLGTLFGFPVVISKHLPPGSIFMVQDPAIAPKPIEMSIGVTVPKISVAQARILAPSCEVSLYDEVSRLRYVLSLRQGGNEVGMLSVHYEDLMANQRMQLPTSSRRFIRSDGRIDIDELSKFLQYVPGPNEWWETSETS